MTDRKLLVVPALLTIILSACQSAALAHPSSTAIILSTSTSTQIPPSATMTETATPALPVAATAWLTSEAPTLAPFPLNALQPSPLPGLNGFPARAAVPLALSDHDHFYFSFPVSNADLSHYTPSQRYGVLESESKKGDPHLGLDIGLNSGTPIRAAASGSVVWAGYGLLYKSLNYLDDPYGISVVIQHDFGFDGERLFTVYAHLRQTAVKVNERVEGGDVIGYSGNTGLSSGPHLHFEVRLGINNVYHTRNPELWLAPPEGYGVLVGRVANNLGVLMLNRPIELTSLDTGKKYYLYTYALRDKLVADDYYEENFVMSDLPAGHYEVAVSFLFAWHRAEVEVRSGAITYFKFSGKNEFSLELPAEPLLTYLP